VLDWMSSETIKYMYDLHADFSSSGLILVLANQTPEVRGLHFLNTASLTWLIFFLKPAKL
jgi:hypothetical protein